MALFGANITNLEQVAEMTAAMRGARAAVIVATDEEGGDVTRLCYAQGSPTRERRARRRRRRRPDP